MEDDKFLTRCLQLANYARGRTYPNPMVGAVVVYEGKIIGEGYHHRAGEPHAEVMAIRSVKNPELLPFSTLYCSLEPCAHFGKTPPCSLLIIQKKIPRVVIGCVDPNTAVNGKGVEMMREAGIDVKLGAMQGPMEKLNAVFFTNQTKERPFFTLKWAQSIDGYMDRERNHDHQPAKISGPIAAINTHRLRSVCDGILISAKTALLDSPSLTTRNWHGTNPRPIVLIGRDFVPEKNWLEQLKTEPILVGYTSNFEGSYTCIPCHWSEGTEWMNSLLKLGIHHVLVEGGGQTLQWFIDKGFGDEIQRYTANSTLTRGINAPQLSTNPKTALQLGEDRYERT
jgi:diaminohydroxyphosphoribosylaminopyrimidine deaminase/5-amino-6-(5-phosphoribosylamino)uracil reductase